MGIEAPFCALDGGGGPSADTATAMRFTNEQLRRCRRFVRGLYHRRGRLRYRSIVGRVSGSTCTVASVLAVFALVLVNVTVDKRSRYRASHEHYFM